MPIYCVLERTDLNARRNTLFSMRIICVASAHKQAEHGVKALDIAKALLDKGYHAPTIYFPLIVRECLMFEPTETESKEQLDAFIADLRNILETAEHSPDTVQRAPVTLPVSRLDETKAARNMELKEKE